MQYCPFVHTLTYSWLFLITVFDLVLNVFEGRNICKIHLFYNIQILAKLLHQKTSSKNNCENK